MSNPAFCLKIFYSFSHMDISFTIYKLSGSDGKLKAYTCHFLRHSIMNNNAFLRGSVGGENNKKKNHESVVC